MQGSVRQRRVGQLKGRNEKKIKLVFVPSSPTVDRENSQPDQFNLRTPTKTPKVSNGSSPLTSNSSAKSQESWTKLQTNWDKIVDNSVREICIPTKAKVTYSNRVRSVQAVSDEENVDQGFSSADEGGTVPVKVKNMHLLLEQGVSKRYKDELNYILDGLLQPKLGIKRSAMMDLLRKSTDPEFLKACRMHNIMDNINPEELSKDAVSCIYSRSQEQFICM